MVNGKRTWHAGSGDAGPAIHVRTVSGSLRVEGHVESTIPTRHEALPEAIEEREFAEGEPEQPEGFAADGFAPPAVPPLPAFPPLPAPSVRDRADQQDATEPIFTPPADWPAACR